MESERGRRTRFAARFIAFLDSGAPSAEVEGPASVGAEAALSAISSSDIMFCML